MPMNPSNFPNPTSGSTNPAGSSGTETSTPSAVSKVAESARDAATKLKSAASDTAHRAAEKAEAVAGEKKAEAAARVDSYGQAIHDSAKSLEEHDPNIAWLAHRAADRLQDMANYVRERDFAAMRADAENFARRHPAAFFGGICVAGLILGSALKASQRKLQSDASEQFDQGGAAGDTYDPDRYARGQETVTDAPSAPAAMI